MKAIVYTQYGPPEVLQLKEIEKPVPRDHEILIRVHASSVTSGVLFIRKGQEVLIYGASGSVGSSAVQLAVNAGAKVTGVSSGSNQEMVKSLGASHVIDYTKEDFTQNDKKYDVIFNAVTKISKSRCKPSLRKNGIYLTVKSPTKKLTEHLLLLGQMAEEGTFKPVIDKLYPLEQTAEAHTYADLGHKKGNVVIKITS